MHESRKLRVLWFTNTPCSASEVIGAKTNFGGWLVSLEEQLKQSEELRLGICFSHFCKLNNFEYKGTEFFPIYRKGNNSKISKLINRWINYNNDEKERIEYLRVIEDFKPDIIHVHGTESSYGLIQSYTSIPVLISIQGILLSCAELFYAGIPKCITVKYEGFYRKLIGSGTYRIYNLFEKKANREKEILKSAKYITGRTVWDRQITSLLSPAAKYYEVNEILRKPFYQHQWKPKILSAQIQIVTTMSESFFKGYETVLKTASILSSETDLNFIWKVLGVNEKSNPVRIVNKWLKIAPQAANVKFYGLLDDESLIDVLLDSDLYVQVSHIENSPNSLCEAQMLGLPTIASYAGGTVSLYNGIADKPLFQSGDPWSLAGKIIEAVRNWNYSIQKAKEIRSIALHRHDHLQVHNDLLKVYSQLIK